METCKECKYFELEPDTRTIIPDEHGGFCYAEPPQYISTKDNTGCWTFPRVWDTKPTCRHFQSRTGK